jgi:hypothetical protein
LTEKEIQVDFLARLTALEHVVEVFVANFLAERPSAESAAFKTDLVSKYPLVAPGSGPMSMEVVEAMMRRQARDLEHFIKRVAAREEQLRGERLSLTPASKEDTGKSKEGRSASPPSDSG